MIVRTLAAVAAALLIATPAFASHCPKDMAAIDAALAKSPDLSEEQLTEVRQLRAQGEEEHKAGNHPASEATLGKAMEILGIEH